MPAEAAQLQQLFERIEGLWTELEVPWADRETFRVTHGKAATVAPESLRGELLRELLSLLRHREATMGVLLAIKERERCLGYLSRLLARCGEGPAANEPERRALVGCLALTRDATLAVVEAVERWRAQMWRRRPFVWKGPGGQPVNYLRKMCTDVARLLEKGLDMQVLKQCGLVGADLVLLMPLGTSVDGEVEGDQHGSEEGGDMRGLFLATSLHVPPEEDFGSPELAARQMEAVEVGASVF
jgi:hypothetical protein